MTTIYKPLTQATLAEVEAHPALLATAESRVTDLISRSELTEAEVA